MKFALLIVLMISQSVFATELKIESHEIFKTIVSEFNAPGSNPEVYPLSENYRLDLTLKDIIDQTTIIAEDFEGVNDRLRISLNADAKNINFIAWLKELKKIADENKELREKLDKKLFMQFYAPNGIAYLPEYKYIDFNKIKDNGKLSRIRKYNKFASDPEGAGLLMAFAKTSSPRFLTKDLTVAKLKRIKSKKLRKLRKSYYKNLAKIYRENDSFKKYYYMGKRLQIEAPSASSDAKRLFKTIHLLPNKHQVLLYLASEFPDLPYVNSMYILPLGFIQKNFKLLTESLKEYTFSQIINSDDDFYILKLRKWIRDNISTIEKDLAEYNERENKELAVVYVDRNKKPGRLEAIFSQEALLTLYPRAPWYNGKHGTIINKNGRHIYVNETDIASVGRILVKLGHELIQTETYLSLLAGTTTLVLTQGNVPVAMGTQKLVKDAVETARYDHEWNEFLKDAPKEVINTVLLSSGFAAGRFYKIVALGAGQGALQSYFTGQDVATGAAVGAGLNLLQYYVLPQSLSRPMSKNFDAEALALNRRLETLEKSIKGTIQGATVAAIEGDSIVKGSISGLAYGFVSAKVMIWFFGTRYYAFKDFDPNEVDDMIRMENAFQNDVGRGTYVIDRQLILDANFRVGGVLPDVISASITLPGNVSMADGGYTRLTTLTHEAHHLMQQHQSGVFGFYLFRYIPTSFVTGYNGHPDENFLRKVIGNYR